jgi:hypothetical protein
LLGIAGAKYDRNTCLDDLCAVPTGLGVISNTNPALKGGAKIFRAYGARALGIPIAMPTRLTSQCVKTLGKRLDTLAQHKATGVRGVLHRHGFLAHRGKRKSMPRPSLALVVAGTSSSAMGIFRERCSVKTQRVFPTMA